MEISLLTAFAVLPVLAVAAAQKGYILLLPDADLYIPRLYPLDGEYVPTSAVQYDRYCYV